MISQADQCLANGAKVVLVTSLDSGSGCKIISNARARGAKVIDYDRLNTGCKGADYYVSFDNATVGKFMGKGVSGGHEGQGPVHVRHEAGHRRTSTAARRTTTRSSSSRATRASSIR